MPRAVYPGTPDTLEQAAKPELETSTETGAQQPDASPRGRDQLRDWHWWLMPNFGYLLIWWVVILGYYVVFSSISGRDHQGLVDPELITDGWYAIFASGLIGAFYAKRMRLLWFLISIVLAMLMLLAMLLGLSAFKGLMSP